jgi:type II restriction enzyme
MLCKSRIKIENTTKLLNVLACIFGRCHIHDIKENKFSNDFKGSSLEFVLSGIVEQKKVFVGGAHPIYWKSKLRIPDIYENEQNKKAFGQFRKTVSTTTQRKILLLLLLVFNNELLVKRL